MRLGAFSRELMQQEDQHPMSTANTRRADPENEQHLSRRRLLASADGNRMVEEELLGRFREVFDVCLDAIACDCCCDIMAMP